MCCISVTLSVYFYGVKFVEQLSFGEGEEEEEEEDLTEETNTFG